MKATLVLNSSKGARNLGNGKSSAHAVCTQLGRWCAAHFGGSIQLFRSVPLVVDAFLDDERVLIVEKIKRYSRR